MNANSEPHAEANAAPRGFRRYRIAIVLSLSVLIGLGAWTCLTTMVLAPRARFDEVERMVGGIRVKSAIRESDSVQLQVEYYIHEAEMHSGIRVWDVSCRLSPAREIEIWIRIGMEVGPSRSWARYCRLPPVPPGNYEVFYVDPDGTRHQCENCAIP